MMMQTTAELELELNDLLSEQFDEAARDGDERRVQLIDEVSLLNVDEPLTKSYRFE